MNSTLRFILRRVIQTIPVLIGVSFLISCFLYLIPGDPATAILGERATQENVAAIRRQFGLDRPLLLNLPYNYSYSCPGTEGPFNGFILDLVVFTIPTNCSRTHTYKDGWALLRFDEKSSLEADRIIDPGKPTEKTEKPDLAKTLRLIGKKDVSELNLEPGVPKTFKIFNGTITVTLNSSRSLFSDLFDSQYFSFLGRILRGDLGRSTRGNTSVAEEFSYRFPATVELSLAALFFAVLIGVPVGIFSALRRNSWLDTVSMFGALIGVSIPIFVLGLLAIYFFSIQLGLLPTGQRLDPTIRFQSITGMLIIDSILRGDSQVLGIALKHILMPALVLSTVPLSIIARITRSAMLEVLGQDYVRTARAKGLPSRAVVIRHALRNALLPIITIIGLQLGTLLSGAVLTESIFSWPGIGRWLVDSIDARDYPTIQAVTMIVALIYVGVNLAVDLSYALLDPRVRYE